VRAAFQSRFPGGAAPGGPGGGAGGSGGQRGAGGGGIGGFGGGGAGGGRLNFAVYHTVHLTDSVTLRDGLQVTDLLRGGTIGSGGQPRHDVEVQAGIAKNGFGVRLTGDWQSATRVVGTVAADDLQFSSLATVNLRLFANLGQLPWAIRSAPWLRGTRISVGVNNLFDTSQRVTDRAGATPLSYQPGYLAPFGRAVRISIRKLLF
jgi:iron complex outermembrane recepter protein